MKKKRETSYEIIMRLFKERGWISNIDYFVATNGSPKLATRISEMVKRGIPIEKRVYVSDSGRSHMEYRLADGYTD